MIPYSRPKASGERDAAALIRAHAERIRADFGLLPVTASEIEFYLTGAERLPSLDAFWQSVRAACAASGIAVHNTGAESGREQFEVSLMPGNDPVKTAQDTQALKAIIAQAALTQSMTADFSAKPFVDQPGSGLHMHLHLADGAGVNVFYKDDTRINDTLKHSIGGLLAWLPDCMSVFAPRAESYARFTGKSNAPTTVSWGANNRTVAVRLPDAPHELKHIEHRVSGVDADPSMVMAVILAAVHYGLKERCDTGPQMFGDASLPMYNLPHLPATLEEAAAKLAQSTLLAGYFTAEELVGD